MREAMDRMRAARGVRTAGAGAKGLALGFRAAPNCERDAKGASAAETEHGAFAHARPAELVDGAAAPIPEPSSMLAFTAGLLSVGWTRRARLRH